MDIKQYLSTEKKEIDSHIEKHFERFKKDFKYISVRHYDSFERLKTSCIGGKGIRGGLFIFSAEMFGFTNKEILYDIAATLEILHASLLIHDDIMDNDEVRRGNTSLYAQYIPIGKKIGSHDPSDYGKSMGICMGDIGFFAALSIFQNINIENKDKLYKIIFRELMTVGLGQMNDITFSHANSIPSIEDILSMYTYKTAHYTFSLPFILGATLTNQSKETITMLENIGVDIGVLFQIKDDEIGLFSNEKTIGKPIGSDIRENKKTVLRAFLENNMNSNEKEKVTSITKKSELSIEDIELIKNIYEKHNIKAFIKNLMDDYYLKANSKIKTLSISEKNKNVLYTLNNYIIKRTS